MLFPCAPLDYETRLYKGCGASELYSIAVSVGFAWLPLAFLLGFLILDGLHAFFISFAIFVGGLLLWVVGIANLLKTIKLGKPEGWHLRMFYCYLHPLFGSCLIYKSGRWSTVREE